MLFATRALTTAGGTDDDWDSLNLDFYLSGITVTAQRLSTDSKALSGSIYAVEFDPTQVRVQNGSFTIGAASASTTVSITSVDRSKAAMVFYFRSSTATANEEDENAIKGNFSADNQLTFQRAVSDSGGAITGHWFVFEDLGDNFDVQARDFIIAGTATNGTATINPMQTNKTFTIASFQVPTMSDADHAGTGSIVVDLQNGSLIRASRKVADAAALITISAFAITFSGDEFVQRGFWQWSGDASASQSTTIIQINPNAN